MRGRSLGLISKCTIGEGAAPQSPQALVPLPLHLDAGALRQQCQSTSSLTLELVNKRPLVGGQQG